MSASESASAFAFATVLLALMAACDSEPVPTRRDAAAPAALEKAPPSKAKKAPPVKAPATEPPTACRPVGDSVVVADASGELGGPVAGQIGERTAVSWTEDQSALLVVVDASGQMVGPVTTLDETTDGLPASASDLAMVHAGSDLVVFYRHRHGEGMRTCDLAARRISRDGSTGEAVVLASDVCSSSVPFYAVASKGSDVWVAHAKGAQSTAISLVQWGRGRPEEKAVLTEGTACAAHGLGSTPDGFIAITRCDRKLDARRLDESGRPSGDPVPLEDPAPLWSGDRLLQSRVRRAQLEIREVTLGERAKPWKALDLGTGLRTSALGRAGGRLWAVAQRADGGFRLAALAPDGTVAGTPTNLPGTAFDADGRHGAAAVLRHRPRQVVFQRLECE